MIGILCSERIENLLNVLGGGNVLLELE